MVALLWALAGLWHGSGSAMQGGAPRPGDIAPPPPAGEVEGGGPAGGARPPVALDVGPAPEARTADLGSARRIAAELDDAAWSGWWTRHRERYLPVLRPRFVTPDGDRTGLVGSGTRVRTERLLPLVTVERRIAPALVALLDEGEDVAVRRAAALALGRLPAEAATEPELARALTSAAQSDREEVAGAALVALGARGRQEDAPFLLDVARDRSPFGRPGARPVRVRVAAALGAGLLAARADNVDVASWIAGRLLALAVDARQAADLRRAALVGFGAAAEASAGGLHVELARAEWLAHLEGLLERTREPDGLRGRAAVALARAALPADARRRADVTQELLGRTDEREPEAVRQGALAGLVLIGVADPAALGAEGAARLARAAGNGPLETRGPAWVGLARVGAAAGGASAHAAAEALIERLDRAPAPERSWCALALGVHAAELRAAGHATPASVEEALRTQLEDARASDVRAALLVASALAGVVPGGEAPLAWGLSGDESVRAAGHLALGAAYGPAVRDELARRLEDALHAPLELEALADALALQGEGTARLTQLARAGCCTATRTAAARALGERGDGRALSALLDVLAEEAVQSPVRAAAARALGRLVDREALALTAPLAHGVDQTAGLPELYDALGHGVLQLR